MLAGLKRNPQGGCVISSFGNHMRRKLERFTLVDPLLDFEDASLAAHAMERLNFLRRTGKTAIR
jgi:hypothetical protein